MKWASRNIKTKSYETVKVIEVGKERQERMFLWRDQRKRHRGCRTWASLEEWLGIWICEDRGKRNSRKKDQHKQRQHLGKQVYGLRWWSSVRLHLPMQGGAGSIPGWGAKIHMSHRQKNRNIKKAKGNHRVQLKSKWFSGNKVSIKKKVKATKLT